MRSVSGWALTNIPPVGSVTLGVSVSLLASLLLWGVGNLPSVSSVAGRTFDGAYYYVFWMYRRCDHRCTDFRTKWSQAIRTPLAARWVEMRKVRI